VNPPDQQTAQRLQAGFEALNRGQLDIAANACQQVLAEHPDLAAAHFLVGLVAVEGDERRVAHKAFKSVIKLDRNHAAAWAQLARLNASEGRIALAEDALKEVRRIKPSDPAVLDLTGSVLNQLGEYETAKAFFSAVNRAAPGQTPYMMNLANALVFNGDIDDAVDVFREVIRLDPRSAQPHWGLANAVKATDTQHIAQMRTLVTKYAENDRAQSFLYYAIGKECEDLEDWAGAFEAFSAGAASRRRTVEFDEAEEDALFDLIRARFTADWLSGCAPGNPDPSPIFVLGQPRTGTTLIERVITSHSQVHSAGELQQFGLATRRVSQYVDRKRFSTGLFEAAGQADPAKIGELYLQTTARMRGTTPHFVDKLPVNYLHLPLILAALPNAKIVHLVRGAMDACFSSFKQLFADAYLHSYEQREMARHHIRYRRLMAHFREAFPGRFIEIHYEDAARDLEPHARSLISQLGLAWEDRCLNFHESDSGVATASAVQVRQPAHTRSIGRWRRYAEQLAPMHETLTAAGIPAE